jgi:myo-inositol-1(or 4)-monophosphatase
LPARDLSLLIDAARSAGEIAKSFHGPDAKQWEKPDGAGPVTEADLAVNDMLEDTLRGARPDYGWLSEESEDSDERLGRETVFIIDPIDGTRSFAAGKRTWAHSIAVARNGVVQDAVIYLPELDRLFAASVGQGATLNGAALAPSDRTGLSGATLLANRGSLEPRHWRGAPPELERVYRPSLAYRMALVAQGRFDAMLTVFPAWEWDIAAGDLILREAGAAISDTSGAPLRFNNANPRAPSVVAAGSSIHAALLSELRPG